MPGRIVEGRRSALGSAAAALSVALLAGSQLAAGPAMAEPDLRGLQARMGAGPASTNRKARRKERQRKRKHQRRNRR